MELPTDLQKLEKLGLLDTLDKLREETIILRLLQNAHDALVEWKARESHGASGSELLAVDIYSDPDAGTLTFRDNGAGMTLEEVRKHLATVGAGYKRKQLQQLAEQGDADRSALSQLIGQYGIGFLSCFIIADKVQVRTRSRQDPNSSGVRAVFTGETRWYVDEDEGTKPGTEVVLQLKSQELTDPTTGKRSATSDLLNFEQIKQEVRRFGDLLPFPVFVHRSLIDMTGDQPNATKGPWEKEGTRLADLIAYLQKRHPDDQEPITAFPFSLQDTNTNVEAHGLIYFPRPERGVTHPRQTMAQVELFCRRMFISDNLADLLPEWATFVGVVVECPNLTPTLDRNDVIRYDPPFVAVKQGLGAKIAEILEQLAERHPKVFKEIQLEHLDRFYNAMMIDFKKSPEGEEKLFRSLTGHLTFQVIHRRAPEDDRWTLLKYREETRRLSREQEDAKVRLYYLPEAESMGQFRAMIVKRDIPVMLALHPLEREILEAYGQAFGDQVSVHDIREILDLYVEAVDQAPYEAMKQFLKTLDGGGPDEAKASRFEPAHVPAIVTVAARPDEQKATALEKLLSHGTSVLTPKIRMSIEGEIEQRGKSSDAGAPQRNKPGCAPIEGLLRQRQAADRYRCRRPS